MQSPLLRNCTEIRGQVLLKLHKFKYKPTVDYCAAVLMKIFNFEAVFHHHLPHRLKIKHVCLQWGCQH